MPQARKTNVETEKSFIETLIWLDANDKNEELKNKWKWTRQALEIGKSICCITTTLLLSTLNGICLIVTSCFYTHGQNF